MKRFPLYRQLDQMECGAACVKMIAEFYGKTFDFEYIQNICSIGIDGVSCLGICNALDDMGFKTIAGKVTFEDLCAKAILPCILHWDQNHFVVLYKIRKRRSDYTFYIADPGKGLLEYNVRQFKEYWISTNSGGTDKGSAILLEPTAEFYSKDSVKKIQPKNRLAFLWGYASRYKIYFAQLCFGLVVGCLILLIFPFLTQTIVDVGIGNKDINFIWLVLLGQLALVSGRVVIEFIRNKLLLHISTRINISLLSDFFIKLMSLPMCFFDTKLLGDILQRVEDHKRVERFLTAQTLSLFFSLFTFIIYGIVLFIYSKKIFLIFIAGSLLYGLWIFKFLKRRRQLDYKYFEQQSKNQSKTYQLINSMQETKLHNAEMQKRWEWEDIQADLFDVNMSVLSLQQTQTAGSLFINETKNILVTVVAATSVINGDITLGMMLSVQFIIGQLNLPVDQLMTFIYQWQDISISLERINDIHEKENESNEDRTINSYVDGKTIRIDNLSFKYAGIREEHVLKNISFDIPEGKTTAIVGTSGSGKSTLIKLLLGYYSPTMGQIYIGSSSIDKIDLKWWRNQCGAVMQNGYIYTDTIAGNIAVATPAPDIERLQYASHMANLDRFVQLLPLKYNTIIGDDGQGLSQGQKQRILIARAIYKDPDYLFLDEATNALDANNERTIVENLSRFYAGRTVVVVAHRLSTVKQADQIIVLENGQIVEQGNHISLTALKGKYYELVKNQLELGN